MASEIEPQAAPVPDTSADDEEIAQWLLGNAGTVQPRDVNALLERLVDARCTSRVVHAILGAMRYWHDSLRAESGATSGLPGHNGASGDESKDSHSPPVDTDDERTTTCPDAATRARHYDCWALCIRFLGRRLRRVAEAPAHRFVFPASGTGEIQLASPQWGLVRGFSFSCWVCLDHEAVAAAPRTARDASTVSSNKHLSGVADFGRARDDSADAVASQQSSRGATPPAVPRRGSSSAATVSAPSIPAGATERRQHVLQLHTGRSGIDVSVVASPSATSQRQLEYRVFTGSWKQMRVDLSATRKPWFFVTVTHSYPYVGRSTASVFVDGMCLQQSPLPYPSFNSSTSFTRASIGKGFVGSIAHPTLYEGVLSPLLVHHAWQHGANVPTLAHQLASPVPFPLFTILGSTADTRGTSTAVSAAATADAEANGINVFAHYSAAACTTRSQGGDGDPIHCAEWRSCGTGNLLTGVVHMGPVPDDAATPRVAVLAGGVVPSAGGDNPFSQWLSAGGIARAVQLVWWCSQWPDRAKVVETTPSNRRVSQAHVALNEVGSRIDCLSCALGTLSCLLASNACFREDMAQMRGFVLLQHVLREAQPATLTVAVVDAAIECAIACKPFRRLFVSAVRSILCEFRIWSRAPWSTQFHVRAVVCSTLRCVQLVGDVGVLCCVVCVLPVAATPREPRAGRTQHLPPRVGCTARVGRAPHVLLQEPLGRWHSCGTRPAVTVCLRQTRGQGVGQHAATAGFIYIGGACSGHRHALASVHGSQSHHDVLLLSVRALGVVVGSSILCVVSPHAACLGVFVASHHEPTTAEMLLLLRHYAQVQPTMIMSYIERANGVTGVVACLESECEAVRVAALRMLAFCLAFRRVSSTAAISSIRHRAGSVAPASRAPGSGSGEVPGGPGNHRRATVIGTPAQRGMPPPTPTADRQGDPREARVLGAALRALQLNDTFSADSISASLELLLPIQTLSHLPHGFQPGTRSSPLSNTGVGIECIEALPVVFWCLRGASWADRAPVLVELIMQLKTNAALVLGWVGQVGWQSWLLSLLPPWTWLPWGQPQGGDSAAASDDGDAAALRTTSVWTGGTPGSRAGALPRRLLGSEGHSEAEVSCATILLDMMALLTGAALSSEGGWKVWASTLGYIRRRLTEEDAMDAVGDAGAAAATTELFVAVVGATLSRLGRERSPPEPSATLRLNIGRIFVLLESRVAPGRIQALASPIVMTLTWLRGGGTSRLLDIQSAAAAARLLTLALTPLAAREGSHTTMVEAVTALKQLVEQELSRGLSVGAGAANGAPSVPSGPEGWVLLALWGMDQAWRVATDDAKVCVCVCVAVCGGPP